MRSMPTHLAASIAGAVLVTGLLATRTYLPFTGTHAQPVAALLTLLTLFGFAVPLFGLFSWVMSGIPFHWPAALRWALVVVSALLLAVLLRFYHLVPAFLLLGWCQIGLVCGEVGNRTFNSVLSAGRGLLILLLLPAITLPILFASHWLYRRRGGRTPHAA
jgi:hypothetical protein